MSLPSRSHHTRSPQPGGEAGAWGSRCVGTADGGAAAESLPVALPRGTTHPEILIWNVTAAISKGQGRTRFLFSSALMSAL